MPHSLLILLQLRYLEQLSHAETSATRPPPGSVRCLEKGLHPHRSRTEVTQANLPTSRTYVNPNPHETAVTGRRCVSVEDDLPATLQTVTPTVWLAVPLAPSPWHICPTTQRSNAIDPQSCTHHTSTRHDESGKKRGKKACGRLSVTHIGWSSSLTDLFTELLLCFVSKPVTG